MTTATQTTPAALSNARRMTARFPGKCCSCNKRFAAGTPILYAKPYTAHAVCPPADAPEAPMPVRAMIAVAPFVAALTAAREPLQAAQVAARAVLDPLIEAASAAALAAGWCPSCNGSGFVTSFDTDYDCGCRTEHRAGTSRAYAVSTSPAAQAAEAATEPARAEVARLNREIEAISRKLSRLQNAQKGDVVTVVKGRKVAHGTTGTVIWVGAGIRRGYYGPAPVRFGIKDAEGTVHWTSAANVEVVEIPAESASQFEIA